MRRKLGRAVRSECYDAIRSADLLRLPLFPGMAKEIPDRIGTRRRFPDQIADRLKVPLFIAHGEDDDTVPAKQSHKMVEALMKAGAPVTSAFFKDSKHDFGSSKDLESWLKSLEAFLNNHNPS